jgi:lipopolysaccharide transport system ATP-binding protein
MSDIVIQAENISKLYKLGTIGTGSLKQDINQWWQSRVLKKKDSFFDDLTAGEQEKVSSRYLWALRDVNFDIKEGEVWGIIGRNGAGKSTLLKVLSRISKPTKGIVRGKGKISSLLEVGTGFDPELTGRENIIISGYMLGMKKNDIKRQFDEIIDFSGIGQFLDTPVKRYSSGMYVRLAFAVAAHLDPDILIVDEVLAVGDSEFQKKCLGKMKDVSTQKGRTILFVSHNMQAISMLCPNAIWLQKGRIKASGNTQTVVNDYVSAYQRKLWEQKWSPNEEAPGNELIKMLSVQLKPQLEDPLAPIDIRTPLLVNFTFRSLASFQNLSVCLHLFTLSGEWIFDVCTRPSEMAQGNMSGECAIPGNFLNDGSYYFSLAFIKDGSTTVFSFDECLHFDMEDYREGTNYFGKWNGYVRPQFPISVRQISDSEAFEGANKR